MFPRVEEPSPTSRRGVWAAADAEPPNPHCHGGNAGVVHGLVIAPRFDDTEARIWSYPAKKSPNGVDIAGGCSVNGNGGAQC